MLINVDHRATSAAMARRFFNLSVLNEILPPNQTAFLPNRVIQDNIMGALLTISATQLGLTNEDHAFILIDFEKAYDRVSQLWALRVLQHYGIPYEYIQWYHNKWKEACVSFKVNGEYTKKIPIRCGMLQGDPDSVVLFNFTLQPLLDLLREMNVAFAFNDEVRGKVKRMHAPAFADDILATPDLDRVAVYLDALKVYCKASNAKINTDKSLTYLLYSENRMKGMDEEERKAHQGRETEKWKKALPYPMPDRNKDIRYLGAYICLDGGPATSSILSLITKANDWIHLWMFKDLSRRGRVKYCNTMFLSRVWHAAGAAGPIEEETIIDEIEKSLRSFIYPKSIKVRINLNTLAMPIELGGLGLVHPLFMLTALNGRDMAKVLSPDSPYNQLFIACLNKAAKGADMEPASFIERRGNSWKWDRKSGLPPFWARLAETAKRLNLTVDPTSMSRSQLLKLPWMIAGVGKLDVYDSDELSKFRKAGLRTWEDILRDDAQCREGAILLLSRVDLFQKLRDANLSEISQKRVMTAYSRLRLRWTSFLPSITKDWAKALVGRRPDNMVTPYGRWIFEPTDWRPVELPTEGLVLAGVAINLYKVKIGRLQAALNVHTHGVVIPHRMNKPTPDQVDHCRKMWADLTDAQKAYKIPDTAFSIVHEVAYGSLPAMDFYIGDGEIDDESFLTCCGVGASRRHRLVDTD